MRNVGAPETPSPAGPWAEIDPRDPGVLQILAAEHAGLLSARSLVHNESFARVASFLTLVSMSFVGLALFAQARGFDRDFLVLAGIVLVFDPLVGLVGLVGRVGLATIARAAAIYFFSTSAGLMVLIVSVLAGLASAVGVSAAGGDVNPAMGAGVAPDLAVFLGLALLARRSILAGQAALDSRFPSPQDQ